MHMAINICTLAFVGSDRIEVGLSGDAMPFSHWLPRQQGLRPLDLASCSFRKSAHARRTNKMADGVPIRTRLSRWPLRLNRNHSEPINKFACKVLFIPPTLHLAVFLGCRLFYNTRLSQTLCQCCMLLSGQALKPLPERALGLLDQPGPTPSTWAPRLHPIGWVACFHVHRTIQAPVVQFT